jgi:hypothetical protein
VLLLHPDADVRFMYATFLQGRSLTVLQADTVDNAARLVQSRWPDVIVATVEEGSTLLAALAPEQASRPMIALSPRLEVVDGARFCTVLLFPCLPADLHLAILEAFSCHGAGLEQPSACRRGVSGSSGAACRIFRLSRPGS